LTLTFPKEVDAALDVDLDVEKPKETTHSGINWMLQYCPKMNRKKQRTFVSTRCPKRNDALRDWLGAAVSPQNKLK
jgi:hypothetical protein